MYRRGGNLPPATWQKQPVWLNDTTSRHVIPSERSESRNPLKQQILPCVGTFLLRRRFLHSADAPVGMTYRGGISFIPTGCNCHGASPSPGLDGVGSTPLHCSVYWVIPFNRTGYICHGASPWRGWSGDESSPLHRSVYGGVPFTRTGCIRYVAGGRLPPLQYICFVLPYI